MTPALRSGRRAAAALAGLLLSWVGAVSWVGVPAPAGAAPVRGSLGVAGKYAAKFQEVANNCSGIGMNLRAATIELFEVGERTVQVTVPAVPIMRGVVSEAGKFKADARLGKTAIEGVDGRFSVAGRVDAKGIQFLFIAEYYRDDRPLCTQSWNGSGTRSS